MTNTGIWIVVALISANILCLNGEQRFVETPATYQEVSTGEDVQLRCKVQDKRGQCIWQKDRKPVGMHPDKYEWVGGRDSDCSLLIRRASLDFDDGFWECQVTPGDFTRQDALTSLPARLLVRVAPRKPRLEYGGSILSTALTLREGQEATISCVSRYGNPPALIKWYIGGDEVEALREQTNATEVDNPRTWVAYSLLKIRGQRENHGLPIRCLTLHPSNSSPAYAESRLDVHYTPETRIETSPRMLTTALEDSASFISLKCIADSNPVGSIKWFKDSTSISTTNSATMTLSANRTYQNNTLIASEVRFEPVMRGDAGLYSCKATNIIGDSAPASYRMDVQYAPKLKASKKTLNGSIPDVEEITSLGTTIDPFECAEYDANPPAQYRWEHVRGGIPEIIENPTQDKQGGKKLRLENVMWSDEGEYRCFAYNFINGVRREIRSEERFMLNVMGPPEIQTIRSSGDNGIYESIGWSGEPVHQLKSSFCSRPPPRLVAWQWGSSHIRAGETIHPKYEALPLEPIVESKSISNCYWAILVIKNVQKEDARTYTLLVESEKGRDSTNLKLLVRDPTEMRVLAAAAAVGLLFIFLLICIGIYCWCRVKHRRYRQEEEEEGSIAADAFYNTTSIDRQSKIHHDSTQNKNNNFTRKPTTDSGLSVMYNYDQMNKQMSPEALKVRRAPAVLQAPTIV